MFKKNFLTLAALAAFCAWGSVAHAQTDVTSTYLKNADFEGTYDSESPAIQPKSDRAIYTPEGWTVTRTGSDTNDLSCITSSDLSSSSFSSFSSFSTPLDGYGSHTYWTRLRWSTNTGLTLSQEVTLPAGWYRLSAKGQNYSTEGGNYAQIFAGDKAARVTRSSTKADSWAEYSTVFYSDGATATQMGFTSYHAKEVEQITAFDNFKLEKLGACSDFSKTSPSANIIDNGTFENTDAPSLGWSQTLGYQNFKRATNKQDAFTDGFLEAWNSSAKTGKVSQTLTLPAGSYKLSIAAFGNNASEGSTDLYVFAGSGKTYVTSSTPTTYTVETIHSGGALEIGIQQDVATSNWVGIDNVELTYCGTADEDLASAYNSAKETYTQDITALVGKDLSTWTTSNFSAGMSGQHWDGTTGDGATSYYEMKDGYGSSEAWTTSAKTQIELPKGKYALVAAGRSSASATLTMSAAGKSITFNHNGDTGKGIDTSGKANYSSDGTYANNNNGRGWEWRVVEFELTDDQTVELAFNGSCDGVIYQYLSYCNVSLLTTSDNTVCWDKLQAAIKSVETLNTTVNVGTDAFQIPSSAVTTLNEAVTKAKTYTASNTAEELASAKETLAAAISAYENAELNKPADGALFNIIPTGNSGYTPDGKALTLTYVANYNGDYTMGYTQEAGSYYAQAFTLTPSDATNQYYLSTTVDGKTVYVCDGTAYSGGNAAQLRCTTDEGKALKVKVEVTATAGIYNLRNMANNGLISGNGASDAGFYTSNKSQWAGFSLKSAAKNSASLKVTSAKWATFIAPFDVEIPEGVTAYTSSKTTDAVDYLVLTEAKEKLAANTPYVLYAESEVAQTVEGIATATATSYADGLLTGVMEQVTVANGANHYVLQNQDGTVAFYPVQSDDVRCIANRAYLTAEKSSEGKSIGFLLDEGETTGISAAATAAQTPAETARYNAAGARLGKPAKGLNIIRLSDGTTLKVMVK